MTIKSIKTIKNNKNIPKIRNHNILTKILEN